MNKALILAVIITATVLPSSAHEWVRINRQNVLTWKNFDPRLVKEMQGKADSIGVVYGKFYSDKFTDAALLSKQNGRLIFEVVRCNPECNIDIHTDISDGMRGIRFVADGLTYLILVPKGQVVETTPAIEGENKHVKLKHDAIEVVTFEKASVVWYWDDKTKKWDTISTAD